MTAQKYIGGLIRGTNAERIALSTTNLRAGWIFVCSDTLDIYYWTGSVWSILANATGEANTASNVGSGQGVWKAKTGVDLSFRSLTATSSKIALANNANDIGIDVTEANLTLDNIGGTLGVAKGGTGATTLTGILKGAGTSAITAVTAPSGTILGTTDTQTMTNKLLSTGSVIDKNVFGAIKSATTRKGGHNYGTTTFTDIIAGGTSTGAVANVNSTIGRFLTFTTATSDGANAGFKQSNITYRKFNPYLKFKGRPNTGPTLQATWFGFDSSTVDPTGDSDADSKSYFAVGNRSSDTNFQIIRNDGSATATYVDTTIPVNTTVRTWELIADETNTRWGRAVDGGAFTYYTTIIPASTTVLTLNLQIELASGGVAKSFDLVSADFEMD